jgi:hypothetical protein
VAEDEPLHAIDVGRDEGAGGAGHGGAGSG